MYNERELTKEELWKEEEKKFVRAILYGDPLNDNETMKVTGTLSIDGREVPNAYTVDSKNSDLFLYSISDFVEMYQEYARLKKMQNLVKGVLKGRISVDADYTDDTEVNDRLIKLERNICQNQLQLIAEIMVSI